MIFSQVDDATQVVRGHGGPRRVVRRGETDQLGVGPEGLRDLVDIHHEAVVEVGIDVGDIAADGPRGFDVACVVGPGDDDMVLCFKEGRRDNEERRRCGRCHQDVVRIQTGASGDQGTESVAAQVKTIGQW